MSYLNLPRLIFAGKFQADPSTVNNDPEHFDTSRFRSNYQERGPGATNGWWNPGGTGAFRFFDCNVQSVVYEDGSVWSDPSVDPIIGAKVQNAAARASGKIVDLDPEQQGCSELWGLAVRVGTPELGFRGDFRVAAFADLWFSRAAGGGGDASAAAFWQSVLTNLAHAAGSSRFLRELLASSPAELSIRFTTDGFDDDATSPFFTFGRVVGAIGIQRPGEPRQFVAGRRLYAVPGAQPGLQDGYALLDGDMLHVDLSNSLTTTKPGGPFADVGKLAVGVLSTAGTVQEWLLPVPYLEPDWYASTGGIASARLSREQIALASTQPLALVPASQPGASPLLAEAPNGEWVRADDFVFRLDPAPSDPASVPGAVSTAATTFYATRFGQRLPSAPIALAYDPSNMLGQAVVHPSAPGPERLGVPEAALPLPESRSITTGEDGTATLTLHATSPGDPRGYIDGQLYGITYQLGATPPPLGSVSNASLELNVLVWTGYDVPKEPDWMTDVRPIFQQYANLYPIMRPIVDLASYASITQKIPGLTAVFQAPVSDPNYMPVTRDLSAAKRAMLLRWLARPRYMQIDEAGDLLTALQQAIELEHATIPPYLTALYSIVPGRNVEIASLIRSIVIEEMLHMGLVSNILTSIGGAPRFSYAGFVPNYPGPLPGGLRADLVVPLRRLSIAQVRDVFMSIEQPGVTVEPVRRDEKPGDPIDVSLFTIGWFYDELARSLTALSASGAIQFGHADRQVTGFGGKLFKIESLENALDAIREIKREGEGAGPLKPGDGERELAHYYKFAEIVNGRRLVRTGDGFAYTGEAVPFDEAGVYPMADDPNLGKLDPASRAGVLQRQFAETYQALLDALERAWSGDPSGLGAAVGVMYQLDLAARQLMTVPLDDKSGRTAGPSFQIPAPR